MKKAIPYLLAVAIMATPVFGAVNAQAAPQKKIDAGFTVQTPFPDNGGDWGWGNCGHNSSKGNPHTGDMGMGAGNGGDRWDECLNPVTPS